MRLRPPAQGSAFYTWVCHRGPLHSWPVAIPDDKRRLVTYLDAESAEEIERIAEREDRSVSNLLKRWIEQRVEQERKGKRR